MAENLSSIDLFSLMDPFDTDARCRAYLEELRWPDGVRCPRCKGATISRIKARRVFDCDGCRYQFSVLAGTVFHDSHLPLAKWFVTVFLLSESRQGMSASQLKRILNVSYKTAWYLCHRIRAAMAVPSPLGLAGSGDVDETHGRDRRRAATGKSQGIKPMILAAMQRTADVPLPRGERATSEALRALIETALADDAVNPDTNQTHGSQGTEAADTRGTTVNDGLDERLRGDVHTNTAESALWLFKRSLVGSFHKVSNKHLDRYVDEFSFRFDNRKNAYLFRDVLLRLMDAKAMPYEQLTT